MFKYIIFDLVGFVIGAGVGGCHAAPGPPPLGYGRDAPTRGATISERYLCDSPRFVMDGNRGLVMVSFQLYADYLRIPSSLRAMMAR